MISEELIVKFRKTRELSCLNSNRIRVKRLGNVSFYVDGLSAYKNVRI